MAFQSKRIAHEYIQTNCAPPEQVFPLLCPVREADWVPDWQYHLIHSESGVAELGCVFITPNEDGSETIWQVTEYDPVTFKIAFVWFTPGQLVAQIRIQLAAKSPRETAAHIRYTYTSLSEEGNSLVDHYDRGWFEGKMKSWEVAINHYLRTGRKIGADTWE
jgi:hypothetical protein